MKRKKPFLKQYSNWVALALICASIYLGVTNHLELSLALLGFSAPAFFYQEKEEYSDEN
jgi:dethiobiotin synthetase